MSKPKRIKLARGETIIAVVPELAAGPGWSNAPTWVHVRASNGTLRTECIQPEERTPELHALYGPGQAMCAALLFAVSVR